MASTLENFPLALVTDGIISYIQWIFGNPEITPDEYRWNSSDRESRIIISGPYVIDKEKPMAAPFIVVERTGFNFENRTINNLKSAKENVFTEEEKRVIVDGSISINIGSQVASEASNLANFLAIMLQADRHGIKSTLGFIRSLKVTSVSSETPAFKDSEIKRWTVGLSLFVSIELGWKNTPLVENKWDKFSLKTIDKQHYWESNNGAVRVSSDILLDESANFGFETSNEPQLLRKEFNDYWYYISFEYENHEVLYQVLEIVSSTELRLGLEVMRDSIDNPREFIPFNPEESKVKVNYKLLWNSVHLSIEIPTIKGE